MYHKALCYCLGISDDTRRNANRIYDFKTGCVKTECIHEGWQTSGSVKVVRMTFNLHCNGTQRYTKRGWLRGRRGAVRRVQAVHSGRIVLLCLCIIFLAGNTNGIRRLMLDRMSLSMKNGWLDDENRAYIIYTVDAIMEDLGCSKPPVPKLCVSWILKMALD